MRCLFPLAFCLLPLLFMGAESAAQRPGLTGRWDLTVQGPDGPYPSWLDVQRSGRTTLVGYFVGRFGSVRPISRVSVDGDQLRFSLPVQWEEPDRDLHFEGRLAGSRLRGTHVDQEGRTLNWTGARAPSLDRTAEPKWGAPVDLLNGTDLTGWQPRKAGATHGWEVRQGVLINARPGMDLVSAARFNDFQLRAEFRYPQGSNSGLYLRGRYEVQIEDNAGLPPSSHRIGGVYGFLTPIANAAKPAGQWQAYDITLVGRRITVALNGEKVLDRQEIPGITGGALDSAEGEPGPLMLQGDHGPIEFRRLTLTPGSQ